MDLDNIRLCCNIDPDSSEDISAAAIMPTLSDKVGTITEDLYVIPEYTPISDQGNLGSCVGNGSMDALEILMGLENPSSVVQLSRLHAYYLGRLYTRETNKDEGTHIRAVFYMINKRGVCPESLWPYDDDKSSGNSPVFHAPPLDALMTADSNKITSYYRIDAEGQERLDVIELSVRANHPVVFGTVVGSQFMNCRSDAVLGRPQDSKGRHCIICTGVRRAVTGRREFLIRNSWSERWGDKGHAWLDEAYLDWDETEDLWVPTRMPKLIL